MVRVGIVGLGGMGNRHFGCHENVDAAEVVAIADSDETRLQAGESSLEINIGSGGATIDPARHKLYASADELIADPNVDLVDVCLPTYLHAETVIKALQAGKHVLCEKPMALSYEDCQRMLAAAADAPGTLMIAQCVRFFPTYEFLNDTYQSGRLGALRHLAMWRAGTPPVWAWDNWYMEEARSGGFILDLHVHDVDFVHYMLGRPRAVCSTGALGESGGYDVVDTQYIYDGNMAVRAAANMNLPPAYGFDARYTAAFENGCLVCSIADGLKEFTDDGVTAPALPDKDGYQEEITYLIGCIEAGEAPAKVMPESSAFSIKLALAEKESIQTGKVVEL